MGKINARYGGGFWNAAEAENCPTAADCDILFHYFEAIT